jgi:hypothetical protein
MNDTCRICHRRPSYPGTKFLPAIRVRQSLAKQYIR